ncbi:response regulator [Butyrivibrio proteoclasticus]|uniref:response regulator n=1 Tax=Butyrivibrio proteoclasticus TaxID=43305 RepID=UPI00047AE741|nr:response regulator [Butyrivibrio proteoclasticus]
MNKYRVMLVDDEEDVAQAIMKKMDWESMGYEVPKYAHNGIEALELAESTRPEVVMSDIKMPYMDGMELARNLKKLYPNIRIIFFSGFDEFEYAKEAIRLEAEEYILKPIDAGELQSVFKRVHESIDKEIDEKLNVAKLENYYMDSLPLLQEDFFSSLIEGRVEKDRIEGLLDNYRISLSGPCYLIALVHISSSSIPEGMNRVLLSMAVRKLIEERIDPQWKIKFFSYLGSTVMLCELTSEKEVALFTDECDKLCRLSESICKAVVTIGVGNVCSDLGDISTSYQGAREAVSYRVLYGSNKAINISEVSPRDTDSDETSEEDALRDVFKKIKMADESEVYEAACKYIDDSLAKQSSIQNYRFFVMDIVSELYRFAKNNQLDINEIIDKNIDIYNRVQQMEKSELSRYFGQICVKMHELIGHKRQDTTKGFVSKAVDYVHDHYDNQDLSIDFICNYLGVSSAYFSTVFKKETGKTFVGYLTDYRMDKAVKMLIETDEKTYVIAQQVGYSDPNYFSYVFKKQFGMSPSKYKSGKS